MLKAMGNDFPKPPAEWTGAIKERKDKNVAKMAETLAKNPSPMSFQSALNVVRDIVKANPDAMLVNEGANALDFTRSIVDMYKLFGDVAREYGEHLQLVIVDNDLPVEVADEMSDMIVLTLSQEARLIGRVEGSATG